MSWKKQAKRELGSLYQETCRQERDIVQAMLDLDMMDEARWADRRRSIVAHIAIIPAIIERLDAMGCSVGDDIAADIERREGEA